MPPLCLTREQVRDVDRRAIEEFGVPGVVLMENAGRGTAELLHARGASGRVVICCGRGNNGGDGFVIARHLENLGHDVHVLLFCPPDELRGDAAINFHIIERAGTPLTVFPDIGDGGEVRSALEAGEWIVDALLGTGFQGSVREPLATVISLINAAGRRVLAVDVPSGLDCDTGTAAGPCVRAEATATFVARKAGFEEPGSREVTGDVFVIGIGIPKAMLE